MLTMLLGAVDQTIVATAMPTITADVDGLDLYAWVFSAYMLASTVTIPIYGKLGDIYGKRPVLLVAVSVFLLGSLLCGTAHSMTALVVWRALQGLGAGGIMPMTIATIGLVVPFHDRGRWQGLASLTYGVAAVSGPFIGAVIVDHTSWRWIFFVNLPVGAVALLAIAAFVPRPTGLRRVPLDLRGGIWLATSSLALLVALQIGVTTDRDSILEAVALALVSLGGFLAFVRVERTAIEPILPFAVVRDRAAAVALGCIGCAWMIVFATITYVPLFVQAVLRRSTTSSGAVLMPLMIGLSLSGVIAGQWIARSRRLKPTAVIGAIVLLLGVVLAARLGSGSTPAGVAAVLALIGSGMGLMSQTLVLYAQSGVPRSAMGVISGLTQFVRSIGSTIGVAIIGFVLTLRLHASAGALSTNVGAPLSVRAEIADALRIGFTLLAVIALVLATAAFLGLREIRLSAEVADAVPAVPPAPAD
jgi:EmrB/QacA subfamily drug resistance transporter